MAQANHPNRKPFRNSRRLRKRKAALRRLLVGITATALVTVSASFTLRSLKTLISGRALLPGAMASGDPAIMEQFDTYISNLLADALTGLDGLEHPPRIYTLNDGDLVAPKPDSSCYGSTRDPGALQSILEQAEQTLGVTNTIFSTGIQLYDDTSVSYYLDDSILCITWRQLINNAVYTFSEVKIAHASQLRRFLADGTYGSEKLYYPTEMATTVNAVTASAGDFYKFRDMGVIVYNGQVQRVNSQLDICYIDKKGNMLFTKAGEIATREQAEQFVADNDVRFSLAFGPILVRDGKYVENSANYPVGQGEKKYSRAAFAQVGELHYLMATVNLGGNDRYKNTLRINDWAHFLADLGVEQAYALDGGQTATIVTNNQLVNRPDYGTQRKISDIIYFATAIPENK